MPEHKKGIARIEVPRRTAPSPPAEPAPEAMSLPSTSQRLMAQVGPARRDPWVTPLAGLLLAFSAISLIIQLLIAFS
ncbi:MAG: hypothetical protein JO069_06845 [Verrucomicrobia bacterium]|nr:hypothetical protein [Verrucomicrobiota bacterium]